MRNVWKGLIIGALTGAAAGLGVEALDNSGKLVARGANRAAETISDRLPDVINKTKETAAKVGQVVADKAPDVAESAKQAAKTARDATQEWASEHTS